MHQEVGTLKAGTPTPRSAAGAHAPVSHVPPALCATQKKKKTTCKPVARHNKARDYKIGFWMLMLRYADAMHASLDNDPKLHVAVQPLFLSIR